MGILSVPPDSFSDGGQFEALEVAVSHARCLQDEGADIIDVGGESTRPGYVPVSAEEEQRRVIPVVESLARSVTVPISIDTYKAPTARLALQAGASIVNDIWGLQRDPDIASVAAEFGAPVIIMHNREEIDPTIDIISDIKSFFDRSIEHARRAGIPDRHIILDPGIGFGKSWEQHLEALRRLPEIRALGFPILVGVSRKSVLGRIHNTTTAPKDRLYGSIASHVMAVAYGADIVRVHDVQPHVEACQVADAIRGRNT